MKCVKRINETLEQMKMHEEETNNKDQHSNEEEMSKVSMFEILTEAKKKVKVKNREGQLVIMQLLVKTKIAALAMFL